MYIYIYMYVTIFITTTIVVIICMDPEELGADSVEPRGRCRTFIGCEGLYQGMWGRASLLSQNCILGCPGLVEHHSAPAVRPELIDGVYLQAWNGSSDLCLPKALLGEA